MGSENVKSNAIVMVKGEATVAGAGQMNRLERLIWLPTGERRRASCLGRILPSGSQAAAWCLCVIQQDRFAMMR